MLIIQRPTIEALGNEVSNRQSFAAVSYTHLTLPTIYSV